MPTEPLEETLAGPAVSLPEPEALTLEAEAEAALAKWLVAARDRTSFAAAQDRQRRMFESRLLEAKRNADEFAWNAAAESLAFLDDPRNPWFTEFGEKNLAVRKLEAAAVAACDKFADELLKLTVALQAHLRQAALVRMTKMCGGNKVMASALVDTAFSCDADGLHQSVVALRTHPLEGRLEKLRGIRDLIVAASLEASCATPEDE